MGGRGGICYFLGFVLVFMEKQVKLRTELDTEYGIKERAEKTKNAEKF